MDLAIGRRELLFGSALLGIGAGASTPARACSVGPMPGPLELSFWRLHWELRVAMPRRRRALVDRFIGAVMAASPTRLDAVLAPDAFLMTPPGDRQADDAGQVLDRPAMIERLSGLVSWRGARDFRVNHLEEVDGPNTVILDVTMTGFGPYIAPPEHEPNTLCMALPADWAIRPHEWEVRLICMIGTDASSMIDDNRIYRITLMHPRSVSTPGTKKPLALRTR